MFLLILFWFFPITFISIFFALYLSSNNKSLKIISGIFFIAIFGTIILLLIEPVSKGILFCGLWIFVSFAYMLKKDIL
jgi:hypothetical protein